ncbi:C97 family peptidase [Photorhabdus heterorhabditis]|nr:C97 family peptidase [Photorhabdus heterorhabditis]
MPVFPFPFKPSGHSYGFIGAYDVMRGKSPGTYFNKTDADLLPYHGGITIKVAPSGTEYTNAAGVVSKSPFGHAWVEFQGESIGWGLGDDKKVGGVDNLTFRDSMAYDPSKVVSVTYPLYSEPVVGNIERYIYELKNGNFSGFKKDYNLLTNNCIDFVNSILEITEYDNEIHYLDYIQPLHGLTPDGVIHLLDLDPNQVKEIIEQHIDEFENKETPLVIDLTGDGITTILENGNLFFDHDNNGIIESSGWIESSSAFLVWDKNKDGKINNGSELFGNNSILKNGNKADNGFTALADLDDNGDGIFDQNDSLWHSLELWIDANRDAITDSGELHKLSESGISSINLAYKEDGFKDVNGNIHGLESTVNWDNGNVTQIVDVYFAVNKNNTIDSVTPYVDIIGVNETLSEAIL